MIENEMAVAQEESKSSQRRYAKQYLSQIGSLPLALTIIDKILHGGLSVLRYSFPF